MKVVGSHGKGYIQTNIQLQRKLLIWSLHYLPEQSKNCSPSLAETMPSIFYQCSINVYVPGSKLVVLGMVIPPLIGNPYNGYINPYYWVDEFIPYYMEIMGV